jgi:hypothetical protein
MTIETDDDLLVQDAIEGDAGWRPPDPGAYAYLLGLFLGDGCVIRRSRGSPQLVLTLDDSYPAIIDEAALAIARTMPGARMPRAARPGCTALLCSHPAWLAAFPQGVGRGRKHERAIELAEWQRAVTHDFPTSLIRRLIHSDGCRTVNRFRTRLPSGRVGEYSYVRYFFTNYSADIRRIFCEHCDLIGVRWTQSSFKDISVAHRDSVALLDRFVGPKR